MRLPDVDIDLKDRDRAMGLFRFQIASELNPDQTKLVRHKTGVYPQRIPIDPVSKLAAFPYGHASVLGYYKIDLIPNHVYDEIESPEALDALLQQPIDWGWFTDAQFYAPNEPSLTHLGAHFTLVQKYPPESVMDVAILLALVRPGKRDLIGESWDTIRARIWEPNSAAYTFKKPHAVAFAMLVGLHARLIAGQRR